MVPVENTEGPSLLNQKGREAETDGSCGTGGGRHPACAGGKVRPWGRLGWPPAGPARSPGAPRDGACLGGRVRARHGSALGAWRKEPRVLGRRGSDPELYAWGLEVSLGLECVKTRVPFPLLAAMGSTGLLYIMQWQTDIRSSFLEKADQSLIWEHTLFHLLSQMDGVEPVDVVSIAFKNQPF